MIENKKEPLKVGDRVRKRGDNIKGLVSEFSDTHALVCWENHSKFWIHRELLIVRRLKPKRKAREWCMGIPQAGSGMRPIVFPTGLPEDIAPRPGMNVEGWGHPIAEVIHVREFKPRKESK